jgi:hypothetical protein
MSDEELDAYQRLLLELRELLGDYSFLVTDPVTHALTQVAVGAPERMETRP